MERTVDALARQRVLAGLSTHTLDHMAQLTSRLTVKTGTCLYQQNDMPAGLFILESGHVILYRQAREKAQILLMLKPGDVFGGESIPNGTPCPYTAKAITPASLFHIAPDALRTLLKSHQDFLVIFLELVSSRLRQLTTLVHHLAFHDVRSRLAAVLLTLIEAEGTREDEGVRIPRMLSQHDLAAMVGTAREVIYRTLRQFEKEGLLRQSRTDYLITNLEKLTLVAAEETR